jgi:hypothetical protein
MMYGISIFLDEIQICAAQEESFGELSGPDKAMIKAGWIELQNGRFPPPVVNAWRGMVLNDCMGSHEASIWGCGMVVECLRTHQEAQLVTALPLLSEGQNGEESEWISCGRHCHIGSFLLATSSGHETAPETVVHPFTVNRNGEDWIGIQIFGVEMIPLHTRE